MMKVFIYLILAIILLSCNNKTESVSNYSQQLHENVIDLRIPGKWRDAGTFFVQTYPHARQEVLDTLFAHILPEDHIDLGQWGRNEPVLWVLAMLRDNYGVEAIRQEQFQKLSDLRQSKEYKENKSFAAHVEQLLTSL